MERRICRKADNNPEIPRKIYRGKRERRRTILPCDPTKSHSVIIYSQDYVSTFPMKALVVLLPLPYYTSQLPT
jgi:hypothetical protein